MNNLYDIVIIGGGPSGITAGIYGIRSGLKVLVIEKQNVGGKVMNTYEIKNFPTYDNISGVDFCEKLYNQASFNNLEIKSEEVVSVNLKDKIKEIKTKNNVYNAKTVIICAGTTPRNLGLEKENEFVGRGISYCALCDGNFFKNKIVAVVGGGDSGMEDAIYLSSLCKKVYVLNRSEKLKAQVILQNTLFDNMKKNGNIEVLYNTNVTKIMGESVLNSIEIETKSDEKNGQKTLKNCTKNVKKTLKIDGLFLAIGSNPDTKIYENQVELNKNGYIVVDKNMQTNLPGIYAGGDCTEKLIRQIITACSDGAICATCANNYIKENFND